MNHTTQLLTVQKGAMCSIGNGPELIWKGKVFWGKDFIKYLSVKEHYFGTYEDDMYYRAERIAQAKAKAAVKAAAKAAPAVYAPAIPGTNRRRQYLDVAEYSSLDDPWNYDLY